MNKKFQEGTFRAQEIEKKTLKKFLIFWEMELASPKLKKLFIFFLKKMSHIENQCFMFQEKYLQIQQASYQEN